MLYRLIFLFTGFSLFLACAARPYQATNKIYKQQADRYAQLIKTYPVRDSQPAAALHDWVGTTNFNMRKPNFVVIHHTAQNSCEQTLKTFTLARTQVSAHYIICKDGTVYHMLNDYLRAWHAGIGRWGNVTDVNSGSIGIELDNNGAEIFPDAQMNALYTLLATLKKTYDIPAANFIGHEDIAPTRKNDPNVLFNWKTMSEKGFGLWYADTTGAIIPPDFSSIQALRIVGYDVRDTTAAITVFKRKYLQIDKSKTLTDDDRKVLYMLCKQFL